MRHIVEGGLILWVAWVTHRSPGGGWGGSVEYGGAEPLQTFSNDGGGYPSAQVELVARADRNLSYLRAYENSELKPVYRPISHDLKFRGCVLTVC